MSGSYSCEEALRQLAEELRVQAGELDQAADTLAILRDSSELTAKIERAKKWAKEWMR